MERKQLLDLWNDMWGEGNWVPSWPDSLAGINAESAAWSPDSNCHSIWQEVAHVTFWRRVTLEQMAGAARPSVEDIAQQEFASPAAITEDAWTTAVAALQSTQEEIAAAIQDDSRDIARIPYHLIHDPYHLGRVTQLRAMQGVPPKF